MSGDESLQDALGTVDNYFAKIGVASVVLVGRLHAGDTIRIKGHTTDFEQVVESMRVNDLSVEEANPGDLVTFEVITSCRKKDSIYKL